MKCPVSKCGLKWQWLEAYSCWADRSGHGGFEISPSIKSGRWNLSLVRDRRSPWRERDTIYRGFKTAQEAANAACRIHTRAARKQVYQKARKREQAQKTLFGARR